MDTYIISTIAGIIIVAIVVLVIFNLKKKSNADAANKFMEGLTDVITSSVAKIISSIKPNDFESLDDFEKFALDRIYEDTYNYVISEAKIALANNQIAEALLSNITTDTVKKFVDNIIESINAKDTLANKFAEFNITQINIEEKDKELEEKYSDQNTYVEEVESIELPAAENEEPSEEELAALNPQTDEEGEFDIEDDSQEIITDKPIIVSSVDKTGVTRYFEVEAGGRKKRVSKEYAEKFI